MDDSRGLVLRLNSEADASGEPSAELLIACRKGEASAYVFTRTPVEGSWAGPEKALVRIRLDKETASSELMEMGRGNTLLYFRLMDKSYAVALADNLASHEAMLLEFQPIRAGPVVARFDLRGLKKYLEGALRECR